MTDASKSSERAHGIDDTVNAIDAHGNHYRRKIRTGIKRGEFILKRGADERPIALQVATPTFIWMTDMKTGKSIQHPIGCDQNGEPFGLCFLLTEEAYTEGLLVKATS